MWHKAQNDGPGVVEVLTLLPFIIILVSPISSKSACPLMKRSDRCEARLRKSKTSCCVLPDTAPMLCNKVLRQLAHNGECASSKVRSNLEEKPVVHTQAPVSADLTGSLSSSSSFSLAIKACRSDWGCEVPQQGP